MLEARLPVPAYDFLLKLSHVFNVMDARGAVGVTERQACFATLRALARQVTGAQLNTLEYPISHGRKLVGINVLFCFLKHVACFTTLRALARHVTGAQPQYLEILLFQGRTLLSINAPLCSIESVPFSINQVKGKQLLGVLTRKKD